MSKSEEILVFIQKAERLVEFRDFLVYLVQWAQKQGYVWFMRDPRTYLAGFAIKCGMYQNPEEIPTNILFDELPSEKCPHHVCPEMLKLFKDSFGSSMLSGKTGIREIC